ncbi:hypothetical protein Agabi119p4_2405 [Agaricus bisporus var. burnettii]|uniref:Uncharacterized protein n=1 Tax=Agaricus bisporus var. burnettii TaxID=192524 RepID=A0A8H7KJX6_AGABI|nr:hypothetical protein Agabi119p4_2405 [Agaricus bisporus var. burnettii]
MGSEPLKNKEEEQRAGGKRNFQPLPLKKVNTPVCWSHPAVLVSGRGFDFPQPIISRANNFDIPKPTPGTPKGRQDILAQPPLPKYGLIPNHFPVQTVHHHQDA